MKRLLLVLILAFLTLSALGQVVPGGGGVGGTITGQIQTATGGSIPNGTLSFSLSQPAILANTATLSTNQVACYTSTAGNIAGVPDPIVLPMVSVNLASGTMPAGIYYVKIYYFNPSGNSIASPEVSVSFSGGTLIVTPPSLHPGSASGYGVAISASSGAEVIQGTVTGWTQFQQSQPLLSGSAAPTVNTSSCNIYFSDQLVPTGTYYTVNLINKNGSQVAGFPQSWCTYGGAGGVINVSQGAPTGNCNVSGVFYPTPIFASPANNATQSVASPIAFPGGISVMGGSPLFQGSPNACNLNSTKYIAGPCAAYWGGGDLGAQHALAAATCVLNSQCHVVVFPGPQQTFSTPISFADNETMECVPAGILDNLGVNNSTASIGYIGSGIAITMNARSPRFIGCDLLLSSGANTGILMAGGGGRVQDAGVRGGGPSTIMIHASGQVLGTTNDDAEIVNSKINAYTGVAIACDYINDLRILNTSAVGIIGNTTGVMLLVDSQCTGVTVSDYIGYNAGKYGLWMRKTLSGLPPQSFFFRNFESDLTSSDGFLFDSSLVSFPLHFACDNCWSAGEGGAGIHISGGAEIAFSHAQIRTNANDGILIDGPLVKQVQITDSSIGGNNTSNAGFNGISIRNHPAQVVISGNIISGSTEGVTQQYGLYAYSDVEGLVFSSNDCSQNVVGCANLGAVVPTKLTYFGNTNVVSGVSSEPSYFSGNVTSGTGLYTGVGQTNVTVLSTPTNMANTPGAFGLLSVRDQTSGGVATFILDPDNGAQLLGSSNITGLAAAQVTYVGGIWRIALTSGATPRLLLWTIFQ
jgi:hypothetical protein